MTRRYPFSTYGRDPLTPERWLKAHYRDAELQTLGPRQFIVVATNPVTGTREPLNEFPNRVKADAWARAAQELWERHCEAFARPRVQRMRYNRHRSEMGIVDMEPEWTEKLDEAINALGAQAQLDGHLAELHVDLLRLRARYYPRPKA